MTIHGIFLYWKVKLRFAFPYKMEDKPHFDSTSMCRELEKRN